MQQLGDNNSSAENNSKLVELISVAELYQIVLQRWIIAISAASFLSVLLAILLFNQPPKYQAEASLIVDLSSAKVVEVQEVIEESLKNASALEMAVYTHIENLKSKSLARDVAKSLNQSQRDNLLNKDVISNSSINDEEILDNIIESIKKNLRVSWAPNSQVIRVFFENENPNLSKTIANLYIKTYIKKRSSQRLQLTEQAVNFLNEQSIELKEMLDDEESNLLDYLKANNLVSVEQKQITITQRISDLTKSITSSRIDLLKIQSHIEQIKSSRQNLDLLMNLPFIGGKSVVLSRYNELINLKRDQIVLAETYFEKHPRVLENMANQDAVSENLWITIKQCIEEFNNEEARVKYEIASLEEALTNVREESSKLESIAAQYRVMYRKIEGQRDIYEHITSRFNETSISQQIDSTTIRVLDEASVPKEVIWPNKKVIISSAGVLFCITFISVPVIIECFDNKINTFNDIEKYTGKKILGWIKEFKGLESEELSKICLSKDAMENESFSAIYGSLRLKLGTLSKPTSFLITSTTRNEGKSIVASNLAHSISQIGYKVLLVDFDFRRPKQHTYNKLNNTSGVIDWLYSDNKVPDDIFGDSTLGIKKISTSNNYLLRSGGTSISPVNIFDNIRMDRLISRLKQEFDIIIYDTPPIGLLHDASLASSFCDYGIYVCRQRVATRSNVRRSISILEQSNAKIVGIVFNGLEKNTTPGYINYIADKRKYYSQDK